MWAYLSKYMEEAVQCRTSRDCSTRITRAVIAELISAVNAFMP